MPVTSEVTSDYSGSLTPTTSDADSETEEEEEEDDGRKRRDSESSSLLWAGTGSKRVAIIMFRPESLVSRDKRLKTIGEKYHLAYKMVKTESKLVRSVLATYGFHEVHPNSPDFNLMWTGAHLKPFSLRSLQDFQKVNHFPRSYEITRKDRLYKNIDRMAHTKGVKHFEFMPRSFLMPSEYQDFCAAYIKDKGPWIVKPIASSRGRGIYLINNPNQVPLEDNIMVCKYISNPLLIDGFKFDIRVYIAVTSYDPLMIYLFEEGLTRFATVKYEKTNKHLKNQMMHLTNYSINKKSHDYVRCEDPDVEDYGNKWSMSAMLRYLRQEGIDTASLMMRIEAVIIKAIIAAELPIATACKMFVPHKENCIELYGFDILVDENLKPWLLEGNLSPSLACDAPLDLKIKSCMISDFFSLVGFQCVDPLTRRQKKDQIRRPYSASKGLSGVSSMQGTQSKRPVSASGPKDSGGNSGLSSEEAKVLRIAKEQYQRRGSFIRIFPTPETWELYGSFLEYKSNMNFMLAQRLFPDRVKARPTTGAYSSAVARMRSITAGQMMEGRNRLMAERFMQYERKLLALDSSKRKKTKTLAKKKKKDTPVGIDNKSLAQGHLKKLTRTADAVSDVSEEEEEGECSSDNDDDMPAEALKASSKLQFTTSSLAAAASKLSSSSMSKIKKGGSQKTGDLNPLTKSAYASARNRESAKAVNGVSVSGGGKSKEHGKSGIKKEKEKMPESKPTSSRRIYTYKSGSKQGAGDAGAVSENAKEDDVDMDDSSSSDEEDDNEEAALQNQEANKQINSKQTSNSSNSPRTKQQKTVVNVLELLKTGGNLGKVQARQAFSAYLSRVQQRLMTESESHNHETPESVGKQEEQMDLVLRFLKRAAGNLRQSFSVVVPSRRLTLPDRKRILAKQLGDFVHIYNRETEVMEHKQPTGSESNSPIRQPDPANNSQITDNDFRFFVSLATESELEEVLTTYTHKNKSASVFLGASKPKSSREKNSRDQSTAVAGRIPSHRLTSVDHLPTQPLVHTGHLYQSEEHREVGLYDTNSALHWRSASSFRLRSSSPTSSVTSISSRGANPSHLHHTNNTHPSSTFLHTHQHPSQSVSSLSQAAYIYSSKLTPPTSVSNAAAAQKRPASACDFNPAASGTTATNQMAGRPISAAPGRGFSGSLHYQTAANEEAIADALQRLAERQAARQYSATSQLQALTQHLSNLNLANMSVARQHQIGQQQSMPKRTSSLSDLANSDPSVQSMVDPALWDTESNHPSLTGNKYGTNSNSSQQYTSSNGTGQPHVLAQQSKELLQQSKAKHQAMVAQVARVLEMWGPQILKDYSSGKAGLDSTQCRTQKERGSKRKSLLDSLVEEVEEEVVKTLKDDSGYIFSKDDVLCNKCEASEFVGAETKLFYSRLNDSYIPIKYVVSKESKESLHPTAWDKVDRAAGSARSGDMTGNSSSGIQTGKQKGYVGSSQKGAVKSKLSKPATEQNSSVSDSPVKKVRSQVERIWNDYHRFEKSAENKTLPGSNRASDPSSFDRRSKSAVGECTTACISSKDRKPNAVARKSAGKIYDGAMAWAKGGAGSDDIARALSGIKQMFHSGELPCKRWRYQVSGASSSSKLWVREGSVKGKTRQRNISKESQKGPNHHEAESSSHNIVSNPVSSKPPSAVYNAQNGGGEPLSLKQRPSSASMIRKAATLGLPTATLNQSTSSGSRPPQIPRPPERPKPIERPPAIRKPLGNTNIPRTGSHPQLTGLSPNPMSLGLVDDASHQLNFYNSLKYDTSTGSTKVVDGAADGAPSFSQAAETTARPVSTKRPSWKP